MSETMVEIDTTANRTDLQKYKVKSNLFKSIYDSFHFIFWLGGPLISDIKAKIVVRTEKGCK